MNANYVIQDEKGTVINSTNNPQGALGFQQYETKTFTVFLFNPDGTPLVLLEASAISVDIFSTIAQASIKKTLSGSTVTPIYCITLEGYIGFQFSLTTTDTGNMAVNNAGLGMTLYWTDEEENVSQQDFTGVFSVTAPLVGTTSEGP